MAGPSRASRIRRGSPRSSRPCAMQMGDVPYNLPDERGHFGPYGGVFVAETLIRALDELKSQYARYRNDPDFVAEFEDELEDRKSTRLNSSHGSSSYAVFCLK